jgi:hypothetical protein
LDHSLHERKLGSFLPNSAPKLRETHQLFFGLRLVSKEFQHPAIQTKIEQHYGGFFHQIKVPVERQDCMQTVIQTSRRFFKYSRVKLKNQKGLSNGATLMLIPSGQTVPLKLLINVYIFSLKILFVLEEMERALRLLILELLCN